jgi:hypothetical protein
MFGPIQPYRCYRHSLAASRIQYRNIAAVPHLPSTKPGPWGSAKPVTAAEPVWTSSQFQSPNLSVMRSTAAITIGSFVVFLVGVGNGPHLNLTIEVRTPSGRGKQIVPLGDPLWLRFNGGAEGTRWYYGPLSDAFSQVARSNDDDERAQSLRRTWPLALTRRLCRHRHRQLRA